MSAPDFVPVTLLKRDHFSSIWQGHAPGDPARKLVLRDLTGLPWWTAGLARWLARREARALAAVQGIAGVPGLIRADRTGILRDWTDGVPLNLNPPRDRLWHDDARRILRQMRRRGVSHNDLAKPQNWLHLPDGRAGVIDFQLAHVHRRPGKVARVMAREDLRHLLKQKARYAPDLLTPAARRLLARKSLVARIWMATGKRVYNLVTRRLIGWSDGEGSGNRAATEGPALVAAANALPGVRGTVVCAFALPGRGAGLYAFVETDLPAGSLRGALPQDRVARVQTVPALPRDAAGAPRGDLLALVAANRIEELATLTRDDPELAATMAPILTGRLNLSDRG